MKLLNVTTVADVGAARCGVLTNNVCNSRDTKPLMITSMADDIPDRETPLALTAEVRQNCDLTTGGPCPTTAKMQDGSVDLGCQQQRNGTIEDEKKMELKTKYKR